NPGVRDGDSRPEKRAIRSDLNQTLRTLKAQRQERIKKENMWQDVTGERK
ncbi:hypothetical protein JOQ06_011759, partial [Pogonophryne albipinna]